MVQDPTSPTIYNLAPGAKLLAPVITPLRNVIPRIPVSSSPVSHRMITSWYGDTEFRFAEVTAPVRDMALSNAVPGLLEERLEAPDVDEVALQTANTLRAFMTYEEQHLLFASNPTPLQVKVWNNFGDEENQRPRGRTWYGHTQEPLKVTEEGWNGIFAQLLWPWSGASVHVCQTHDSFLSDLCNLIQVMSLNGATPDTLYLNAFEALRIQEVILGGVIPYVNVVDSNPHRYSKVNPKTGQVQDIDTKNYRILRFNFKALLSRTRNIQDKISRTPYPEEMELRVHPLMPQGNILVASTKLPEYIPQNLRVKEDGTPGPIPDVWSLAVYEDYTERQWWTNGKLPVHLEIRTKSLFRLHTPYLFGWLKDIPMKEKGE